MFESHGYASGWLRTEPPDLDGRLAYVPPELDVDAILARDPSAAKYFLDDPDDWTPDPVWTAEMEALEPDGPERILTEADLPLWHRDLDTFTDAETLTRLIQVETSIAEAHALRARLVANLAAVRPASADRPADKPGAARRHHRDPCADNMPVPDSTPSLDPGAATDPDSAAASVPEVLEVSEWLPYELQMAHPYSRTAVVDLVETSLALTGPLSATLELLAAGRIDYPRARVMADLLSTCTPAIVEAVQAMVLPKAPGLTPGGLATAVRRALAKLDAQALRRRHARARRTANVQYWATQDGMARLVADLPLPVAAACSDAIDCYAHTQRNDMGDLRPIGQIRTEILTDLILRPWTPAAPPSPDRSPSTSQSPRTQARHPVRPSMRRRLRPRWMGRSSPPPNAGNFSASSRAGSSTWRCIAPIVASPRSPAPPNSTEPPAGASARRVPERPSTATPATLRPRHPMGPGCARPTQPADTGPPGNKTDTCEPGTAPAGTSAAPAKPCTPTSTTTAPTPTDQRRSATCAATAAPTTG